MQGDFSRLLFIDGCFFFLQIFLVFLQISLINFLEISHLFLVNQRNDVSTVILIRRVLLIFKFLTIINEVCQPGA